MSVSLKDKPFTSSLNANKIFTTWAVERYSGMIGNIHAPYWFCGIEFGGESEDHRNEKYLADADKTPVVWDNDFKQKYPDYYKWPVYRKISKILVLIRNRANKTTTDKEILFKLAKEYQKEHLFTANSDAFLMNLYPLSFNRENSPFTKADQNITGLELKKHYKVWCRYNRFPSLNNLFFNNKTAKVLICFSSNDTVMQYLTAFGAGVDSAEIKIVKTASNHDIMYFKKQGKLICIIPFLGQGGLMDDQSLYLLSEIVTDNS